MANKDDYLTEYRQFFEEFAKTMEPNDQLPVKLGSYKFVNSEVVGGIVDWCLQYLNRKSCPSTLVGPLTKITIDEIRLACKKHPIACGFNPNENVYEPLKLMQTVMSKVNEICLRYLDNSQLDTLPSPPTVTPPMTSVCASRNTRRRMEDRHVVIHDIHGMFNIPDTSPTSYYAIFDGHAGPDAASYSAAHLHQFLVESEFYPTDPERALKEAFLRTDEFFLEKSKIENFRSGTTAVCALLRPKEETLYVAWVGDSQALLVNRGKVLQIVKPHKPSREDEKDRIEANGGCVMFWGMWRVNGQLAVSRAIGDIKLKPYVTAEPDIVTVPLDGNEEFLIMACDGLWDFVSEDDAAIAVYKGIKENPENIDTIAETLSDLAKQEGSRDNISIIIIFLKDPSKIAKKLSLDWGWSQHSTSDVTMEGVDNTNINNTASNNAFDLFDVFQKRGTLDHFSEPEFKPNGTDTKKELYLFDRPSNGKRPADEFDEEEEDDFGPETDVDGVDDVLLRPSKAQEEGNGNNNVSEKMDTLDVDLEVQRQQSSEFEPLRESREETPTPPADSVLDSSGLADNVAESEDSEDEWNYYRVDPKEKENTDPLETNNKVSDTPTSQDEMSQLNPDAKEFIPVSPTRVAAVSPAPYSRDLVDDTLIAQSPRRAEPMDINVPSSVEFQYEVKLRPSELFDEFEGEKTQNQNGHSLSSQEIMQNLLNGKDVSEIEFHPQNYAKPVFGNNIESKTNADAAETEKENISSSEEHPTESPLSPMRDESDFATFVPKPQDPMSMSFYQDKDEEVGFSTNPFDLNKVQLLPDNVDDFIAKPVEVISPAQSPLGVPLSPAKSPSLRAFSPQFEPSEASGKSPVPMEVSKSPLPLESPSPLPEESKSPELCEMPSTTPEVCELQSKSPMLGGTKSPELEIQVAKSPFEVAKSPFEVAKSPFDAARLPFETEISKSPFEAAKSPVETEISKSPFEVSKSPFEVENSKSPFEVVASKSPFETGLSKSPEISKSPFEVEGSKSPFEAPKSPFEAETPESQFDIETPSSQLDVEEKRSLLEMANSPVCGIPESPVFEMSKAPVCEISKSPVCEIAKSPLLETSKTPEISECPVCEISQSPNSDAAKLPHLETANTPDISECPVCEIANLPEDGISSVNETLVCEFSKSSVCDVAKSPLLEDTKSPEPEICNIAKSPVLPELSEMSKSPICEISKSPVCDLISQSLNIEFVAKSPVLDVHSPLELASPIGPLSPKSPIPELTGLVSPDITASIKDENISGEINQTPLDGLKSPIQELENEIAKSPLSQIAKSPLLEITKSPLLEITKSPLMEAANSPLLIIATEDRILSPEIEKGPFEVCASPVEEMKETTQNVEQTLSELVEQSTELMNKMSDDMQMKIEEAVYELNKEESKLQELISDAIQDITEHKKPEFEVDESVIETKSPVLEVFEKKEIEDQVTDIVSEASKITSEAQQIIQDVLQNANNEIIEQTPKSPVSEILSSGINSFLERSVVPEVTSPLSPIETVEKFQTESPEPWKQNLEIKCETIKPEFAVHTITSPSEESKGTDTPPPTPAVIAEEPEMKRGSPEPQKIIAAVEKLEKVAAKPLTKSTAIKKQLLTKTSPTSLSKPLPSKTTTATKKPPSTTTTKTTTAKLSAPRPKPSTTPVASPRTLSASRTTPKPRTPTTTPISKSPAADKKPLTNGDAKPPARTMLMKKTTVTASTASKSATTAASKPATTAAKLCPTKPPPITRPTTATTAKAPAQRLSAPRPATVGAPPRPKSTGSTAKPTSATTATVTTKTTASRPSTITTTKPTTTTARPKPATTTSVAARPRPTATAKPATKLPDTEKQIKETANKQLSASRTTTSRTTATAARTASSTAKKTDTKTASARTTTRTTTTTLKSTTKKPTEVTRTTVTKTKTAVTKPAAEQNGVVNVIQEITTTIVSDDPQLLKDNSPVENVEIDNSKLPVEIIAD